VVSITPRPHFIPGKTLYPFYRRLVGPQGRSGRAEKPIPPRFVPGQSSPWSVAIPTELPDLYFYKYHIKALKADFNEKLGKDDIFKQAIEN